MAQALRDVYALAGQGGRIFSVRFVKRNGEERLMVCRSGVRKNLTGKGLAFVPEEHQLYTVFDMQKRAYRFVPTDPRRVIEVRGRGNILLRREDNG